MVRKIRIEYAGAACHVMARGNQGRDIYADERDRKLWLETLGEASAKTDWCIPACVMKVVERCREGYAEKLQDRLRRHHERGGFFWSPDSDPQIVPD